MMIVMDENITSRQQAMLKIADSFPESSKVFTLFELYAPGVQARREIIALSKSENAEWNTKERYRLCHIAQLHGVDVLIVDDIRLSELCMYEHFSQLGFEMVLGLRTPESLMLTDYSQT
jgi:hypothetical protein